MSDVFADKTGITIGASRFLTLVLLAIHGGALAIALLLPIGVYWRAGLSVLVLASSYITLTRYAWRTLPDAVRRFAIDEENDACRWLRRVDGDWETGRLVDRWVRPQLTLLVVRRDGHRWPISVVIAADAVAPEAFRRLRVRLLLGSAAE